MIYFIHSPIQNKVKIGKATKGKLHSRLMGIQIGNPDELVVLGVMDGGRKEERQLHLLFRHLHVRGEWFKYEAELKEFIETQSKCPYLYGENDLKKKTN